MAPPAKKAKLLEDSSSDEGGSQIDLQNVTDLKINSDYAKRFEHNKKREELHRLEEKLGKSTSRKSEEATKKGGQDASESNSNADSSSESEDEDDDGKLATTALDAEIAATLHAIRSKDPRVYDNTVTFYTTLDDENGAADSEQKTSRPMYLRDYHRQNLLNSTATDQQEDGEPLPFAQAQAALKKDIVNEINAMDAQGDLSGDNGSSDEDDFLVAKEASGIKDRPDTADGQIAMPDIENADRDPETFLSNFMAARAWVPRSSSQFQPFESDDEEEDRRAEEYEVAYNFRFEDPQRANEKLRSHAREAAFKSSVRREEPNRRKKQRDTERLKKETAKQVREEERARLRKLKIEELKSKAKKIRKAAGLRVSDLQDEDWGKFLEEGWDDEKWEKEMAKRFGDSYYAQQEYESGDDEEGRVAHKAKLKKPKWDDDIDINDLIPDFREDDGENFSLSENDQEDGEEVAPLNMNISSKSKKKQRAQEESERKREARKERRKIEQVVDQHLDLEMPVSTKAQSAFRYRETSPQAFGMSASDILMADDTQLNQFAGLKKLATFRDAERKRKDQKKLGKKARLRQWRKDAFGDESGPKDSLADFWRRQLNARSPQDH